jgi:hypothetical protein
MRIGLDALASNHKRVHELRGRIPTDEETARFPPDRAKSVSWVAIVSLPDGDGDVGLAAVAGGDQPTIIGWWVVDDQLGQVGWRLLHFVWAECIERYGKPPHVTVRTPAERDVVEAANRVGELILDEQGIASGT